MQSFDFLKSIIHSQVIRFSVECACTFVAPALIKVHIHLYIETTGPISLQVDNCPGEYQQPGSVSAQILV